MAFDNKQLAAIKRAADSIDIENAALLAFFNVETAGTAFAKVKGQNMPLIRWEGHYFKRLLSGAKLKKAMSEKLAGDYGVVKNPSSQEARYEILARGKKIDYEAAVSSCSWGIGQVMGSHWKWLGYQSAKAFEDVVTGSFEGQLDVIIKYMQASDIIPHIKRRDWSAVARLYNGKNYKDNKYDTKMKAEYEKISGRKASQVKSAGMLRPGSSGAGVREAQDLLNRAGFSIEIDGDFGSATQDAVIAFQKANNLEADGVIGPKTHSVLTSYLSTPEEEAGRVSIGSCQEVRKGVGVGVGGAVVISTAKEQVDGVISQFASVEALSIITNSLMLLSGSLAIAGIAYAVYGFMKNKKTFLGTEDG